MDKQTLSQNLIDSGCDKAIINEFFLFFEQGKIKEALRLLSLHRGKLIDNLCASQKKIDCLDYLIFYLRENK